MRRFQTLASYFVALALIGVASLNSAEPVKVQGKAIVRSVSGTAFFTTAAGVTGKLRVNRELEAGATISTGSDSYVYLNINGLTSAVRIAADTTLSIPTMNRVGSSRHGDTQTILDLRSGEIVGNVKKISATSTYTIKTPQGQAASRGGDFVVSIVQSPDGKSSVTFLSLTGQVIVSAVVDGDLQARTLNSGEIWTPGVGGPHVAPPELINKYGSLDCHGLTQYSPSPIPPVITNIMPVFPTGGPPRGGASPPAK
jgi:hypothetical protein